MMKASRSEPAEFVFCFSLQRARYTGGGGVALPLFWHTAQPDDCGCRDEPEFALGH